MTDAPEGLDPRARRLLALMSRGRAAGAGDLDVAARRAGLRALSETAGEPADTAGPPGEDGVLTVGGEALPVRRHRARDGRGGGLLYLHGGGFVAGGLETHDALCRRLCRAGAVDVFALAYPLAPERPFPAALHAVKEALLRLTDDAHVLGLDGGRLPIAGDSAGGCLAAAAARDAAARGAPLRAQLLITPILDVWGKTPSRRRFAEGYLVEETAFAADVGAYLGATGDAADPDVSPLRAGDLSRAPPALVHLAPFDPFHDEGVLYADRLRAAGVSAATTVHPGMIHYFAALGGLIPAAREAVDAMGAGLRALVNQ